MTATSPGPGTLVLLRHGESEWNKANLFTGWVDVPLSDKGRAEAARRLGYRLRLVKAGLRQSLQPFVRRGDFFHRHGNPRVFYKGYMLHREISRATLGAVGCDKHRAHQPDRPAPARSTSSRSTRRATAVSTTPATCASGPSSRR